VPSSRANHATATLAIAVVLLVLALNALLLRAGAPPPGTERAHCVEVTPLGRGFRYIENCDSPVFLLLAKEPSLVLTPDRQMWQSRALYPALAHALAVPLEFMRRYGPQSPEWTAYALINLAAVALGATLFARMLTMPAFDGGVPDRLGPELTFPLVLIMVNDLTKAFFWTPHLQMFNILMPCLTLYATARLIRRKRPLGLLEAAIGGLILGFGLLVYGAFMVTAATLALVALIVYRQVLAPGLFLAAFAVPLVCWMSYVRLKTGGFYSHEVVAYRQFVWMLDCARAGAGPGLTMASANGARFLAMTQTVVTFPLMLIALAALGRRLFTGRSADHDASEPAHVSVASTSASEDRSAAAREAGHAIAGAVTAYLLVATIFLAAMGFYTPRLSWALVPALLALAVLELRAWRVAMSRGLSSKTLLTRGLHGLSLAACAAYVFLLFHRFGPFS
jgi:hypothetical protein